MTRRVPIVPILVGEIPLDGLDFFAEHLRKRLDAEGERPTLKAVSTDEPRGPVPQKQQG